MPPTVSPPATDQDLFARLAELGIDTDTVAHDPVFTVEEARRVRTSDKGTQSM